ncbi:MAG: FkbM family methyltransferase [Pirellulaceae bacterium]|nr:FkbM family methyltransferase [Pirellulaceae bacterium]
MTGSVFEPNTPLIEMFQGLPDVLRVVAKHPVNTVRLDDLDAISDIDLIKIDIQGGELTVLENAIRQLKNVAVIQTEINFVELYKKQPLFADVDRFLRSQNFQFHFLTAPSTRAFKPLLLDNEPHKGLTQTLWTDAVYVKDWMRLDELSIPKLKNFAVIIHDIFRSYDLAHLILQTMDRKANTRLANAYMARLMNPVPP